MKIIWRFQVVDWDHFGWYEHQWGWYECAGHHWACNLEKKWSTNYFDWSTVLTEKYGVIVQCSVCGNTSMGCKTLGNLPASFVYKLSNTKYDDFMRAISIQLLKYYFSLLQTAWMYACFGTTKALKNW